MAVIIGLTGKARSGKDTIADYISAHYGHMPIAFADPIRWMIGELGVDDSYVWHLKEAPIPGLGASYRKLAQTLGTEWGRNMIDPDLWIRVLESRLRDIDHEAFIITDVRFPNEAAWVRRKGILVHVVRDDAPGVREHVSEDGIAPLEGEPVIHNNGSLDDLHHQIRMMMAHIEEAA